VDLNRGLEDLVAVALVAALAPLIVAALPGPPENPAQHDQGGPRSQS